MDIVNEKVTLKNVKIADHIHKQVKYVSISTGINVGRLIEMGAMKILEDFKNGKFDEIKSEFAKIKRNGSITRI
jgi:hypothetical protein